MSLAEQQEWQRTDAAEDLAYLRRMERLAGERCKCGTDLPGRCPGPAFCTANRSGPECRICNIATHHRQDADDTWICADCEELER